MSENIIQLIGFNGAQIYILYEAVVNDIENIAHKPDRKTPKSGKYQYKWDILQELKEKLDHYIDWDKLSDLNDKMGVEKLE